MKKLFGKEIILRTITKHKLEGIFQESALDKLQLHIYNKGEIVCQADWKVEYFSIVIEGRLKIMPISSEGKVALIDYIEVNDILGDIEYFLECPYLHTVKALKPTTLISVPMQVMKWQSMKYVPFLNYLSSHLAHKLERSSKNYSQSLLYPIKNKLCKYLLEIYDDHENNVIPFKNAEVAQILGSTDRHLGRLLSDLAAEGVIIKERGSITILLVDILEEYSIYIVKK